jgi:Transmembrane domain of unknown function (DUF3566)
LKRRADTSDGSGGASPMVVTTRRDDDDDLTAAGDQPTEIIAAEANGTDRPEPAVADPSPAMPADSIKRTRARSATSSSRPTAAQAEPEADGQKPADPGVAAAEADLAGSTALPAAAGNGQTSNGTMYGTGSSGGSGTTGGSGSTGSSGSTGGSGSTGSSADGASPAAEAAAGVSAAAFAWDAPESPSATAPSAARNFLRSSATRASAASRKPAAAVGLGAAASHTAPPSGQPSGPPKRSARQAHLTVARVEPWSVMKFSFLVSLIAFVILFVAVAVIFGVLSALGVFTSLQHVVQSLTSSEGSSGVNAANWFTASRVLGYTALLGCVNIVLITAMATIGAVIYNLTSRLIGGVEVTLRETE